MTLCTNVFESFETQVYTTEDNHIETYHFDWKIHWVAEEARIDLRGRMSQLQQELAMVLILSQIHVV